MPTHGYRPNEIRDELDPSKSKSNASSYEEDLAMPNANTWLQAMRSVMDSIHQNQTWELVKLPTGRKALPCKWVFRYKYVSDLEKPKYNA